MKFSLTLILSFYILTVHAQVTVSGVDYPKTVKVDSIQLVLNGAGVKSKWFFDLYTAGIYIPKKSSNPEEVINCDCPMVLRIVIVSSYLTVEKFNESVDSWFDNSMGEDVIKIKDEIDQFKNAFGNSLSKYDEFYMVFYPNLGIKIFKNKNYKTTIKGLEFKVELAKLWLGPKTTSLELKDQLLGK